MLLGHLLSELLRQVTDLVAREVAPEAGVELHPLAARRHRVQVEPESAEPLAQQQRDAGALVQAGGLAGVEVDDEPVGVEPLAVLDPPLGYVQLDAVEVDQVGQLREVLDEGIGDVGDLDPGQPARRAGGQVLLEEAHVLHPVREAHPRHRSTSQVREHRLAGAGVVREDLALRRLGRGVHDLVERGQAHRAPGHLDPGGRALGVSHRSSPAGRQRSGRCAPSGGRAAAAARHRRGPGSRRRGRPPARPRWSRRRPRAAPD